MQIGHDRRPSVNIAVNEAIPSDRQQFRADAVAQRAPLEIGLLTGGQDRHYAVGLAVALMEQGVAVEVIGSDEVDGPEFQGNPRARFHNLHGSQQSAGLTRRIARILVFYMRLLRYTVTARPGIFHILWNNKLPLFDRTFLMLFYKLTGKRIVLTAHNVNAGRRDGTDSGLNRITLRFQYKLTDHLFVHTKKMKDELVQAFAVEPNKVTVIPYGINNAVPFSELTRDDARRTLGLRQDEKVILSFGAIKQYKGLEDLVAAFQQIAAKGDCRLVIAGERKKGHEDYWRSIQQAIYRGPHRDKILQKIGFIPDSEIESYYKAADVAVLSYTEIFQSGILFLTYAYGVPVIATDVGSFSEDIVEGRTGFVCKPRDPADLAATIERFFASDLYKELDDRHQDIRDYALASHSWDTVGRITRDVYSKVIEKA
jgi:glycosyltransferase involved in cell wall biosynthesis